MTNREHQLPVCRQIELLGISRGSVYYHPVPASELELDIMRRIDELHLEHPWMGSRKLRSMPARDEIFIGRRHAASLMKNRGADALYRKPKTSRRNSNHKVYHHVVHGMNIDRADKVRAMDISCIPMAKGFVCLRAVAV